MRPDPKVAAGAIERLVEQGLLSRAGQQGALKATTVGAIVGQLPVSLAAGRVAVLGCARGVMRHAVLCAAIMSTSPQPIIKQFGRWEEHQRAVARFGGRAASGRDRAQALLANLAAYEWWESSGRRHCHFEQKMKGMTARLAC
jgi:HrpA-like RNA helicase